MEQRGTGTVGGGVVVTVIDISADGDVVAAEAAAGALGTSETQVDGDALAFRKVVYEKLADYGLGLERTGDDAIHTLRMPNFWRSTRTRGRRPIYGQRSMPSPRWPDVRPKMAKFPRRMVWKSRSWRVLVGKRRWLSA